MFFSDESDDGERTRTPSGMELGGKVQGIRSFFSPVNKSEAENSLVNQSNRESSLSECVAEEINRENSMSSDNNNNIGTCENQSSDDKLSQLLARHMEVAKDTEVEMHSHLDQVNKTKSAVTNKRSDTHQKASIEQQGINAADVNNEPKMVSSLEQNADENPKSISVAAVVEMFKSLKHEITTEIRSENTKTA